MLSKRLSSIRLALPFLFTLFLKPSSCDEFEHSPLYLVLKRSETPEPNGIDKHMNSHICIVCVFSPLVVLLPSSFSLRNIRSKSWSSHNKWRPCIWLVFITVEIRVRKGRLTSLQFSESFLLCLQLPGS